MVVTDKMTAYDLLEELRMYSISDKLILEYVIGNYLSASIAKDAMLSAREEFLIDCFSEELNEE